MSDQPRKFRYVMTPVDLFRRRWYVRLRPDYPSLMEQWYHLVILAQESRAAGRLLVGGEPMEAEDIAVAWDRRAKHEDISLWEDLLTALVDEGAMALDSRGGYRLAKASDWYLPPSKLEERDHAGEWQARKQRQNASRDTDRPEPAREASDALGKTREDPGSPGNTREPNENENENENENHAAPLTPQPGRNGGQAARSVRSLEAIRPLLGARMQRLGLMGTPTGRYWTAFAEWAGPGIDQGAQHEDLVVAVEFGVEATLHEIGLGKRVQQRWNYANRIAAEHLAQVVARRRLRDEHRARGEPEPRPYRFAPPEPMEAR